MKSAFRLVITCGLFFMTLAAHAVNANHSGTICKNYNASQVTDIDYVTSGTRNLNASPRSVIYRETVN